MNRSSLRFVGVQLEVFNAVITECSKQREHVQFPDKWAPTVHCGGSGKDGRMIYTVETPPFALAGAVAIAQAAEAAQTLAGDGNL
jgi:hypothetical protein